MATSNIAATIESECGRGIPLPIFILIALFT